MIRNFVFLALTVVINGCAVPEQPPQDPLVERIFRTSDLTELAREELIQELHRAQVIYFGERHDNLRHHELQLSLTKELLALGRRPAIGFEVFSLDQTSLLMQYVTSKPSVKARTGDSRLESRLRRALGWSDNDDRWSFYGPLLMLAREHGLTVFGGDLNSAMRRRITRVGTAGLTSVEQRQLHPSNFHDPEYEALMRHSLKQAHCDFGSEAYIGRLYSNWLARNDAMATAIVDTLGRDDENTVVMILGAGHVQHNMGVYERVANKRPDVRQLNLGFREVSEPPQPVEAYTRHVEFDGARFDPIHEYLWFSRRVKRDGADPCEAFRRHIKRTEGSADP